MKKLEEAKRALEKCLSLASENEEARRTLRGRGEIERERRRGEEQREEGILEVIATLRVRVGVSSLAWEIS